MSLFRSFKGGKTEQDIPESKDGMPGIRTVVSGKRDMVTVDLDSFGRKPEKACWRRSLSRTGYRFLKG